MNIQSPHSIALINQLRTEKHIQKHLTQLAKCDTDSFEHSLRVGALAIDIAEQNNLSEKEISLVGTAGLLHDIGKCDIPKEILTKNGSLTASERKEIEKHSRYSFERLKEDVFATIRKIIIGHHEYSTTPYPRTASNSVTRFKKDQRSSLEDEAVPFLTQILAVADIFDALSNPRVYKKAYAKSQVREIMQSQFIGDKKLIEQALERY